MHDSIAFQSSIIPVVLYHAPKASRIHRKIPYSKVLEEQPETLYIIQ